RLFDVVVWGGAGFTGRLIVEYLCRVVAREHPRLRWAIAARDRGKMEAVKAWAMARAGPLPPGAEEPAILVGDARSQESVDRIVGEARVVISAAGPFWTHGAPVVDACVRLGADYVDIAGETPWFKTLATRFHAAAEKAGVRIVPACGFDSV
ncbi:Saccharopine dehydrogenase, partial [Pavlovales sp. CCMP2436]